MTRLIFVHGAFANKASWFDLPDEFRTAQRTVTAETLPGHTGTYPFPTGNETLQDYVAEVTDYLSDDKDNWLIGHSMGGMVISQVAANEHEKIAGLVYIAAILPEEDKSTIDYTGLINPKVIFPNHNRNEIKDALTNQPLRALDSKFKTSAEFKNLTKYYVVCSQDNVIDPTVQEDMARNYDVTPAYLDSDHLPMHKSDQQPGIRDELARKLRDVFPA